MVEVVVHHQHADRICGDGEGRDGDRERDACSLQDGGAGDAEPEAGAGDRFPDEGAVGGADGRLGVEDGAGHAGEAEGQHHQAAGGDQGETEDGGEDEGGEEEDAQRTRGEEAGDEHLAAAGDDAGRGVAVGAGAPVLELVDRMGKDALDEDAEGDGTEVVPALDVVTGAERGAEGDGREAPQKHRDDAQLEPQAS
jgi:hypothetical protein